MDRNEEAQFERVLLDAVEAARKHKYHPVRFVGLIQSKGAFQTVKDIVASGKPSEGFDKLVMLGLTELTCESIIVETRWRQFFDEDLLGIAERRLSAYKHPWQRFEPTQETSPEVTQDDFIPPEDDHRERSLRLTHQRPAQLQFREALIAAYGARCCVTGCAVPEALEAAHISSYRGEPSNHLQNGLLLRADVHNLFDRYLFSIAPTSLRIELSPRLKAAATYLALDGAAIDFGRASLRPSLRALALHWQEFREPSGSQSTSTL